MFVTGNDGRHPCCHGSRLLSNSLVVPREAFRDEFHQARHTGGIASSGLCQRLLPARLLQPRSRDTDLTPKIAFRLSEPTEHSQPRYLRNKAMREGSGRELDKWQSLLTPELIIKIGSVPFAGTPNLGNLVRMFGLPLRPAVGLR